MLCICFLFRICLPPRDWKLSEHKDLLLFMAVSPASTAVQGLAQGGGVENNYRMCDIHNLNQMGGSDRVCMLVELRKDITNVFSVFMKSTCICVFVLNPIAVNNFI